jgi:hypothetical protein
VTRLSEYLRLRCLGVGRHSEQEARGHPSRSRAARAFQKRSSQQRCCCVEIQGRQMQGHVAGVGTVLAERRYVMPLPTTETLTYQVWANALQ